MDLTVGYLVTVLQRQSNLIVLSSPGSCCAAVLSHFSDAKSKNRLGPLFFSNDATHIHRNPQITPYSPVLALCLAEAYWKPGLPETTLLLVATVVTNLGDDVVLVLEDEASLAVVFVPVELHHQWLLIQVQLPFFCQREKGGESTA